MQHAEDTYPEVYGQTPATRGEDAKPPWPPKPEDFPALADLTRELGGTVARIGLRLTLARAFHKADDQPGPLGDWDLLSEHGRAPYFNRADTALEVLDRSDRHGTENEIVLHRKLNAYQDATGALMETVSAMATPENADKARDGLRTAAAAIAKAAG